MLPCTIRYLHVISTADYIHELSIVACIHSSSKCVVIALMLCSLILRDLNFQSLRLLDSLLFTTLRRSG